MPEEPPHTAILYQNHSRTVILIDIPTSIALAQTAAGCPSFDALLSCEPVRQPYPFTEPKSEAARAKVLQRTDLDTQALHSCLRKPIQDALLEIRTAHKGDWCLPRHLSPIKPHEPLQQKGKPVSSATASSAPIEPGKGIAYEQEPSLCGETASLPFSALRPPLQLKCDGDDYVSDPQVLPLHDCVVHNDNNTPVTLNIGSTYRLRTPPLSTFIQSSIESSVGILLNAAKEYLCKNSLLGSGQFDFILADPPWSNRSVRRSKKYKTLEQQHSNDPWETVRDVLGKHLAPGGLVGIWVTNKAEPRRKVLAAFQHWNVQLVEEWVWVKTTLHGELVTELDGIWRRPYEIFLLGRKSYGSGSADLVAEPSTISRRFICGVPDLHSRKPSLKELVEPLMPERWSYRALEVFARNLTAGWWSWGDEVLKFNWEDNWVKDGFRPRPQG